MRALYSNHTVSFQFDETKRYFRFTNIFSRTFFLQNLFLYIGLMIRLFLPTLKSRIIIESQTMNSAVCIIVYLKFISWNVLVRSFLKRLQRESKCFFQMRHRSCLGDFKRLIKCISFRISPYCKWNEAFIRPLYWNFKWHIQL